MKKWIALGAVLVLLAAAVGGFLFWQEENRYVKVNGEKFLKELTELDLRERELTPEEYDAVCAALPECRVYWRVPFQDTRLDDNIQSLTVAALTEADLDVLPRFAQLRTIDATACRDYEEIQELIRRYPDCEVLYQVEIGGVVYDKAATKLETTGADLEELNQKLSYLPEVTGVTLTEPVTDAAGLHELLERWPGIDFCWNVMVLDQLVSHDTEELDLSGIPLEGVEEVEAAINCLPNMRKVIMCDCGISNEEMDALNRRHESVQYVWNVTIGKSLVLRTDITTFMPGGQYNYYPKQGELYNLRYCTEIVCLDLGHRAITDCEFVAYMPHLKYLILADTLIEDITPLTGLKELVFLELFISPIQDYTPLTTLTSLDDLNLSFTHADPEPVARMTWLKRLWWDQITDRAMSEEQKQMLRDSLPNTEINFNPNSSTGGTWRLGQHYFDMRDMLGMKYMVG